MLSAPGLVGRWGLNASSGTNVADSSGSGVNGTAVGGPSWVPGYPLGAPTPVLAFTPGSVSMAVVDGGSGSETVDLAVSDGSAAAFTVSGDAEAWLTVSPLSGATPATLTLDVDASALTPGSCSATVTAVASGFPNETLQVNLEVTPATTPFALDFDGTNDHVTFGLAPGLGAAQFTIETWFMRQGPGTSVETGTSGIPDAVPLVTKGTSEDDDTNVDMNYYLGIDQSAGVLVADFEEGATGADPGLNHPVRGTTVITNNVWHHAAATYDGQVLKLYLDGILQGSLTVNQPVRSDSIQHAALGTGITSTGTPEGFFEGVLDEARIWNVARTVDQINATKDVEVTSATGLIGRWGMNEGAGTSVGDSSGGGTNGTATGGPAWVAGYPFSGVSNTPPGVTLNAPADGATGFSTIPTLDVTTSDADGGDVTTTFFGRRVSGAPGPDFTIVAIPDTQHYVDQNGANLSHFTAQVQLDRRPQGRHEHRLRHPPRRHRRAHRPGRPRVAALELTHGGARLERRQERRRARKPRHELQRGRDEVRPVLPGQPVRGSSRGTAATSAAIRRIRSTARTRTTTSCSRRAAWTSSSSISSTTCRSTRSSGLPGFSSSIRTARRSSPRTRS